MKRFALYCFMFCCVSTPISSQVYQRIEAEYSYKLKTHTNESGLILGKILYDKFENLLVVKNNYPLPEFFAAKDTISYKLIPGRFIKQKNIPLIYQYSFFHIILTGQLSEYGLQNTSYSIVNVENNNDKVISTWMPPENMKKKFGKIQLAKQNGQLFGIVMYSPDDRLIMKQFFEEYVTIQGLKVPSKIIQIMYDETGNENYQITNLRNIEINKLDNTNSLLMQIPDTLFLE